MKCLKCEKEVSEDSKFCNACGFKVEEKHITDGPDETMRLCSKVWFMLGFMLGTNLEDKKALDQYEKLLKKESQRLMGVVPRSCTLLGRLGY